MVVNTMEKTEDREGGIRSKWQFVDCHLKFDGQGRPH